MPEKRVVSNPVFGGVRDFDDTFRARLHRFLEQVAAGVDSGEIDGSGADGLYASASLQTAIASLDEGNHRALIEEL